MKLYEIKGNYFYHASSDILEEGETYKWDRSEGNGTFGDYEKIMEHFRPSNRNSRLNSFYLASTYEDAEQFTDGVRDVYKVITPEKTIAHSFGWFSVLLSCVEADGYDKNGYVLSNETISSEIEKSDIKEICNNYWSGKKFTANDAKKFDIPIYADTIIEEILVKQITVVELVEV